MSRLQNGLAVRVGLGSLTVVLCANALGANRPWVGASEPLVEDAISDRYHPLDFDQEKLGGLLARRLRANSEGFLEHAIEAHGNGAANAGKSSSPALDGRLLEAAANAYKYRRDTVMRSEISRAAKDISAAQADPSRWPQEGAVGPAALLTHKYDILGLLEAYRVTGDSDSLAAARTIGQRVLAFYPKGETNPERYLSAMTLAEPFVALYRYTEENRFLEVSKAAAEAWLGAKDTRKDTTAETIAELDGLVDLYRLTGIESYIRPVVAAWSEIHANEISLTGDPLTQGGSNACATFSWMELTENLLRLTGEPKYADQVEQTIYNALFARQDGYTGSIYGEVPLNGSKLPAARGDDCAASEAEAIALIPALVWGRDGNGIAVLLYNPGRASVKVSRRRSAVQLYADASFPESGDFLLHVEPAHPIHFPLRLRVPEWTDSFAVDIAGNHLLGTPGEYVTINREWQAGDTVKITMGLAPKAIQSAREFPGQVALQRGPQVLALPRALNPEVRDLAEAELPVQDPAKARIQSVGGGLPASWPGDQAYAIAGVYAGRAQQLVLAPFADARTYRVFLKRAGTSTATASIQ